MSLAALLHFLAMPLGISLSLFDIATTEEGSSLPGNAYVAEDGATAYVAEDGVTYYVQES